MAKKKTITKILNFATNLIVGIFMLILSGSIATGQLTFPEFLNFIPATVGIVIGWIFVVLTIVGIVFSFIELLK